MSKSNTAENEMLLHYFNNQNIANIGDATGLRGSTAAGNFYACLHTSDPGEAGSALTGELSYTGYARQAIPRSAGGFTVSGASVSLTANVDFPKMTGGTGGTVTHFSIVKEVSGASVILYSGAVSPTIVVANGVIPRLETGTTITED